MSVLSIFALNPIQIQSSAMLLDVCGWSVAAGFPSPAADHTQKRIDLNEQLVRNKAATFLFKVKGDSMTGVGIYANDMLVVDRSIDPKHNSIVVAIVDGECTVKYLHQRAGRIKLRAANPTYPDIIPRDSQTIEVWGVVVGSIKLFSS